VCLLRARIIQRALNLASAVATHLTVGGLAAQSINILFKYVDLPRGLGPEAFLTHSYKGASPL